MVRFRTNGQIIKNHINLVNPANKRNLDVIVVGTGLAGGSASATAELGYNVKSFLFPRFTASRTLYWHKVELTQQKLPRRRRFRFQIVL
jgi:hypothetical protein